MNLYNRYINGDTKQVYQEIYALGDAAFSKDNLQEIEKVLAETFRRVTYNLDIIYKELKALHYAFKAEPDHNYEKPLHKPLPDTTRLLQQLDKAVKPVGFVPLSLKYFYTIVGGVNLAWDYETDPYFMWELADPIQVASLNSVIDSITNDYWVDEMLEYIDDEDFGVAFIELAADELHKDNISGGPAYAIQLTKEPSIDSKFLNEPNSTTFVDYLRICFENCGFPGLARADTPTNYQFFLKK